MLYPPCHLVCCLEAPTGASVSHSPRPVPLPRRPGHRGPGPSSVCAGIYRAGSVVRSVLHRQCRGITQVFTCLCIFWVTFYFTVVQGRKGSRICVPAFSQNCRKSIQCLVCKQGDKSEIKQRKRQTPPRSPTVGGPTPSVIDPPVLALSRPEARGVAAALVITAATVLDSISCMTGSPGGQRDQSIDFFKPP